MRLAKAALASALSRSTLGSISAMRSYPRARVSTATIPASFPASLIGAPSTRVPGSNAAALSTRMERSAPGIARDDSANQ